MDSSLPESSTHHYNPVPISEKLQLDTSVEPENILPCHHDGYEGLSSSNRYLMDSVSHTTKSFLHSLIPSFAQRAPSPPHKVYKTAWLDGLRGVASLMVMLHHSSWLWYPELSRGWGSSPDSYHFVQLPVIRIFYMGSAMVAIFFVISGFSLSHKALGLIRHGRYAELLSSLGSSTFRRGMRLVIPPVVLTFFMMLATYMNWYGKGDGAREPPHYDTFSQNFWHWAHTVMDISDIFRPMDYPGWYNPPYDTNLWTIDVEWHGSLVIFLTLLGLSKVHAKFRLFMLVCIPIWLEYRVHTHLFLFMSGVFLAELHHIREDRLSEPQTPSNQRLVEKLMAKLPPNVQRVLEQPRTTVIFWSVNFVVAIYLLSMPLLGAGGASSPGYIWLASMIPSQFLAPFVEDHFWIFLAAVHFIFTVDNAPFLQTIFTTPVAQYLGRVGFALYLVHGTFLYTIGWNLSARILDITGREAGFQYGSGVFLTVCILYPLIFCTADFVYRQVDVKSVTFARWLHTKVSI